MFVARETPLHFLALIETWLINRCQQGEEEKQFVIRVAKPKKSSGRERESSLDMEDMRCYASTLECRTF